MPLDLTKTLTLALTLLGAACGEPEDPSAIGDPCTDELGCGGGLSCVTDLPGGYCTERCTPGTCPAGAHCDSSLGPSICLADCLADAECNEGYFCSLGSCLPGTRPELTTWGDRVCATVDGQIHCEGRGLPFELADWTPEAGDFSLGWEHRCALVEGRASCEGRNDSGETEPPDVSFRLLRLGARYGCGLEAESGEPRCWGLDRYGNTEPPATAMRDLSVGVTHACGLTAEGDIACWGDARHGALDVPPGPYTSVAAGQGFTCATRADGSLDCWGLEDCPTCVPFPDRRVLDVPEEAGPWVQVVAGNRHACARSVDGRLICWGESRREEPTRRIPAPTEPSDDPPATSPALAIAAAHDHTCAVGLAGETTCWVHRALEGSGGSAPTDVWLSGEAYASDRGNSNGARFCIVGEGPESCFGAGDGYFEVGASARDEMTVRIDHPAYVPALKHWAIDMNRSDMIHSYLSTAVLSQVEALGADVEGRGAAAAYISSRNNRFTALAGVEVRVDTPAVGPFAAEVDGSFMDTSVTTGSGLLFLADLTPGDHELQVVPPDDRVCEGGVSVPTDTPNGFELPSRAGWMTELWTICR